MIPSTLFSWAELHWQQYQGTFFRWDYHKTADYRFLRACNIKSRACNIKSRACNITWYILTRAWYIRVRASYIKSRTCNLRPELATLKTRTCNLRDRNLQPYGTELATLRNGTCNLTEQKFTISFCFFVNSTSFSIMVFDLATFSSPNHDDKFQCLVLFIL